MNYNKILKDLMKLLGITQKQLADKLGVTQVNVSKRLNSKITAKMFEEYLSAMGCKLEINIYLPNGDKF